MNEIIHERGAKEADITQMERIIRDFNQQLCVNKMYSLEEMDKFLEK